ncbi:phytoene desaturase family protein [Saccharothrix obliqua]|uniref:phytoene desaturase family protein n=1 Tax=Saccharothrix obliqua TaxID=2861747 RepID=UPI001C5EB238|nr:phytoene desaturase family protein [Saccharothrix obliqua]MBW4721640.1 phytoene desaturase [Saccharothrix obliqua]
MRTVTGRTDHVVVVGAGLAGLSAALHLLGAGRRVTVVERDDVPGGRAGRLDLGGYRFDTGPTVLTMPELVEEALNAVGESLADRLDLLPVTPAYRARFADGSVLDVHADGDAMEAEVRRFAGPAEAAGYRALRSWLTELYRVERDAFIGANFDSPLSLLTPQLARLAGLRGFARLGPSVARFLKDERLQRVFSFQSLYAGVSPRRALAAYAVIAYMDTIAGVYYPRGGMRALPDALADAARDAGAELRYRTKVAWLERIGRRVTAVRTAQGERIPCDAVVLTPDLPMSYRLLGHRPRRPVPLTWAPSAAVLHAGVDRTWPELAHHTLFFGGAWDRTFDELTRRGTLMSDPSLLVTSPPGRGMFVLAPTPNLRVGAIDWDRVGPAYRDEVVQVLQARGLTGFGDSIEVESLVTPKDWAAMGLAAGTPFSVAHTFAQTGPFRPRNLVLDNAVLAGCGTTPGVGVPPVLISGKLAAQRVTGHVGAAWRRPAVRPRAQSPR